jgi:predicted 2-oxoglutarate/Fe(II)-dependent dioxygenase YbiX
MNAPIFPFRPGDRVPDLALPGPDGRMHKLLWAFQGEPLVLIVLADGRGFDDDVRRLLADVTAQPATPALLLGIAPATAMTLVSAVKAACGGTTPLVLCDAERRFLATLLAPSAPGAAAPPRRVLVLDANQRLVAETTDAASDAIATTVRDAVALARAEWPAESLLFGSAAPALILPRVFELAFCRDLIALWECGDRADGGVSSRYGNVMAADRKRTEDHIVNDPAMVKQIADRLAFRIGPELVKAFAWDVAFGFDAPVVMSYSAEGAHYFRAHRDNTAPQTADRTFAVSLNLNEDYDGGELVFPEYGPTRYRPKAGAAAVFSCSLLHEALPVRRGRRFVLTTFFRNRGPQAPQQRPSG